jgi:hypothetical protein
MIRIKTFRLVFVSITDRDSQGKVTGASIIDLDNQARFSLIINDNHEGHYFTREGQSSLRPSEGVCQSTG